MSRKGIRALKKFYQFIMKNWNKIVEAGNENDENEILKDYINNTIEEKEISEENENENEIKNESQTKEGYSVSLFDLFKEEK